MSIGEGIFWLGLAVVWLGIARSFVILWFGRGHFWARLAMLIRGGR